MDADEISWLRANKHRIVVGTSEEGLAQFELDDAEVYDALDDYLEEVLEGSLGEFWYRDPKDEATGVRTHQIIFRDPQVSKAQLLDVVNGI